MSDEILGYCSKCGRASWEESEVGKTCGMIQPDKSRCEGKFSRPERATPKLDLAINALMGYGTPMHTLADALKEIRELLKETK